MSKTIVNLTTPFVITQVEQVLETYPDYPEQHVFANPDVRQDLIAYVLTRIHSIYITIEEGETAEMMDTIGSHPMETQSQIQAFIHEGIRHVMQANEHRVSQCIGEENEGCLAASHWFG